MPTSKKTDVEMEDADALPHPPPKTAYVAFLTEEMDKRKQKDENVEFGKLSQEIAAVWKSLNPEQKKKYEKKLANQTIDFWWKLAKWGANTGNTEYVVPKKEKSTKSAKRKNTEEEEEEAEEEIVVKPAAKKAEKSKGPAKKKA